MVYGISRAGPQTSRRPWVEVKEMEDLPEETILEKVERMQNALISYAIGDDFYGGDSAYKKLRDELLEQADVWKKTTGICAPV